jgi:hypothetical protein
MKQFVLHLAVAVLLTSALGCDVQHRQPDSSSQQPQQSPFLLSVVPTDRKPEPAGPEITMAQKLPGDFYAILTNISKEPQAAFETWNSWGYQAISFEIQTVDGQKIKVSKKPQLFTKNYPSIFIVPPSEHMVFPISLDNDWDVVPPLPMTHATPMPIMIKAIYEVRPSLESAEWRLWTGHLESRTYDLKVIHR